MVRAWESVTQGIRQRQRREMGTTRRKLEPVGCPVKPEDPPAGLSGNEGFLFLKEEGFSLSLLAGTVFSTYFCLL